MALSNFTSGTGFLVLPEVVVDDATFYDDVTLRLNFATNTFEIVSFAEKPPTIKQTAISSVTQQDIKMDFLGCARTNRTQVTCHLELTSLGGIDKDTRVFGSSSSSGTQIFDDLGNTYFATAVIVGNLEGTRFVNSLLVAGIPTLAKFQFEDVSPSASSISLLKPWFDFGSGTSDDDFSGDFRDIEF